MSKKKTNSTITVEQFTKSPTKKTKNTRKHDNVDAKSAYKFVSEEPTPTSGNKNRFPYLGQIIKRVKSKLPQKWGVSVQARVHQVTEMAQKFEKKHLAHRGFYQSRIRPLIHNLRH